MKIGVFDSGYGGLTILKEIKKRLPQYDYLYVGDNARNPYGSRSFELVYEFTLQAVKALFERGCHLVILACNTASAKALRSIQQNDLPHIDPNKRVLGVIRPTVEAIPLITQSRHVGVLATPGTVLSRSYSIELNKFAPDIEVTEHPCPMWVPIVENNEIGSPGADYFIKKEIDSIFKRDSKIDTLVLGCTHYPLLVNSIKKFVPESTKIICQGSLVAESLECYLDRHADLQAQCSQGGSTKFLTTEHSNKFDSLASLFLDKAVESETINLTD